MVFYQKGTNLLLEETDLLVKDEIIQDKIRWKTWSISRKDRLLVETVSNPGYLIFVKGFDKVNWVKEPSLGRV